ncbi:MAG: winged helix-turn-helix domain-containing protein, partial [Nitrospiraceae bacterium]
MGVGTTRTSVFRLGAFELDLSSGELREDGVRVKLPPQPFKVLALLASRPGELVTRKEIQQQIWGSETFVDFEEGLNFCIKQIRTALGDDAETPRYIETLPRHGYRFIAPVEELGPAQAGEA